jgi:molecular chaperone GrpE
MAPARPQFDKMQEKTVQPQEADKPLEQQLIEAQAQAATSRDAMLRALADAENARKRFQAEAANAQKYALERFAESLLPVMDSLEAALKSADLSGVEITLKQLRSVLDKSSIREIEPKAGERFDPHRHQAMAAVEAKAEPNTVVSVLQKGYSLHDRVLRPALVTIAKTPSGPISDQD